MHERRLSYRYSFKCGEELKHFDKLPNYVQANIERYIVQVISDSFVKPADEDYVTARLMAQKGMYRAFFWAASQSLEKYFKAFLLMRGVSVNRFKGHPVAALYAKACSIDSELLTIDTTAHSAIKIHPNVSESIDELSVAEFINDIESQGSPDNRYNSFGVSFNSGYLFALDSFAFGLRQQIGMPPIEETLKKMDQSFVEAFNLYNPWFAPVHMELAKTPNEDFNLCISDSVTTLDILTSSHAPNGSRLVLQWLDKKMKLPKKVKQHLSEG